LKLKKNQIRFQNPPQSSQNQPGPGYHAPSEISNPHQPPSNFMDSTVGKQQKQKQEYAKVLQQQIEDKKRIEAQNKQK